MSRKPTAATTNYANGANGASAGQGVDPAGAAAEATISRTEPMTISEATNHGIIEKMGNNQWASAPLSGMGS